MIAHTTQSMHSVAVDMEFSSQQAFTRAFTRYWGVSPQHFRQAHAYYIAKCDKSAGSPIPGLENLGVKVQATPEMHFWAARYEGLSKQKHECWNDFRHLFAQHAPERWEGSFFGLTYDTPMFTPQPFVRYYCGVLAGPDASKKPKEAFEICLPAGRVATVEAQCMAHDLLHLYDYLLDHWLPRSGYSLRASCFAENFSEIPVNWNEQPVHVKLACWIH